MQVVDDDKEVLVKKIRRKLSQSEVTLMRLNRVINGLTQYLKERGMFEDCQAWFKVRLQGGDGTDGMQRNEEDGRKDADEGKGDDACCGEDCGCKEGEEEVG